MATLTINTTSAEDTRIFKAFGRYRSLGRDATGAEVKAAVINFVKSVVSDGERLDALEAEQASFTNVAPT